MSDLSAPVLDVLDSVFASYGMSREDGITHLLLGDRHHGDAPDDMCGMVDPRDEARWCARLPNHPGGHNRYRPTDGCDWNDHCGRCCAHVCVCRKEPE